jgi:LmbE family N-acetylglucosaminyl deacetylase
MNSQRTLVFAGAHPDDESFGVGGTLAQYAAAGVKVYYLCGTRGEVGEADAESLKGYSSVAEMRWAELECAAKILGLSGVIYLGYRDSGMPGSEDNKQPDALAAAPLEQVTERIVRELRRLKPQVVITFDPIGGYHHPDHIMIHRATAAAFRAAGDPQQFPGAGPVFQPQKLYYHVFPKTFLRLSVRFMRLLGRDPRHFGKNRDIDLTRILEFDYPVHAVIRLDHKAILARDGAASCHASQLGGGSPRRGIMGLVSKIIGQRDSFMRAEPPVTGRLRENDLFDRVV